MGTSLAEKFKIDRPGSGLLSAMWQRLWIRVEKLVGYLRFTEEDRTKAGIYFGED
jgi:hypothetical protein